MTKAMTKARANAMTKARAKAMTTKARAKAMTKPRARPRAAVEGLSPSPQEGHEPKGKGEAKGGEAQGK
eukprot:5031853-Lingulodinium_polyedra.AAC.1